MSQTENCPYTWLFSGVPKNYYTRVINSMVKAIYYTRVVNQVYEYICEPFNLSTLYDTNNMHQM